MTNDNKIGQQINPTVEDRVTRRQFLAKGKMFTITAAMTGSGLALFSNPVFADVYFTMSLFGPYSVYLMHTTVQGI
jgi:hypothetical protein